MWAERSFAARDLRGRVHLNIIAGFSAEPAALFVGRAFRVLNVSKRASPASRSVHTHSVTQPLRPKFE